MQTIDLACRAFQRLAVVVFFASIAMPLSAQAEPPPGAPPCNPRHDLIRLSTPLRHVAHKLASGEPITIVALGS